MYSLLGNAYGGDGVKTFGLPDLRGVLVMGCGQRPGSAASYPMGSKGGDESQRFSSPVEFPVPLPAHTHEAKFTWENDTSKPVQVAVVENSPAATQEAQPGGRYLAAGRLATGTITENFTTTAPTNPPAALAGVSGGGGAGIKSGTVTVSTTGEKDAKVKTVLSGTVKLVPPYAAIGFIICCEGGDYPPQAENLPSFP